MSGNEQVLRDFIAAWSRLDVEELVAYFTPDGTYYDMPLAPVSGHDALRQFIEYNRFTTTPTRRKELSWRIILELDYVIRWSPADFPLMPMVMLKRADYLMHFGRSREAFEGLGDMLEMYPGNAEAHARLAWYLRRSGRQAEADQVLARARTLVRDPAELDAAVQRLAAVN